MTEAPKKETPPAGAAPNTATAAAARRKTVELIAIHTVVTKEDGKPEVRHEPGPKAKPFRVEAKEGARLIGLGAARPADEAEDDLDAEEEGTVANPSTVP